MLRIAERDDDLAWHTVGKLARKYGKIPQLSNYQVSKTWLILIHPENVAANFKGCLLLGILK